MLMFKKPNHFITCYEPKYGKLTTLFLLFGVRAFRKFAINSFINHHNYTVPVPSETVASGFEDPTAKLKPEPGATVTGVGLNPKPVKGVELAPPIVFVADS